MTDCTQLWAKQGRKTSFHLAVHKPPSLRNYKTKNSSYLGLEVMLLHFADKPHSWAPTTSVQVFQHSEIQKKICASLIPLETWLCMLKRQTDNTHRHAKQLKQIAKAPIWKSQSPKTKRTHLTTNPQRLLLCAPEKQGSGPTPYTNLFQPAHRNLPHVSVCFGDCYFLFFLFYKYIKNVAVLTTNICRVLQRANIT